MLKKDNSVIYDSTNIFNINNEFNLKYIKIYKKDEDLHKYVKEVDVSLYEKYLDEEREYD